MSKADKFNFRLDVDLISLRALVAIADAGSFSAAATRIGRTQSAVSLQISKLETRLQTKLLERTSRSVRQTPAGELLIAYARRILDIADEAALALSAPDSDTPLRIGFAEYLAPEHLHEMLGRFRRAHPTLTFELKLSTGHDLRKALDENRLDVAIAGPDADNPGTRGGVILLREAMVWAQADQGGIDRHAPLPLVTMQSPCSYRKMAIDALNENQQAWRIVTEANSIQGVRSAVKARLGITAMPASAVGNYLTVIRDGLPVLAESAMAAYRADVPHPLTDRFISFLKDGFEHQTFTANRR